MLKAIGWDYLDARFFYIMTVLTFNMRESNNLIILLNIIRNFIAVEFQT